MDFFLQKSFFSHGTFISLIVSMLIQFWKIIYFTLWQHAIFQITSSINLFQSFLLYLTSSKMFSSIKETSLFYLNVQDIKKTIDKSKLKKWMECQIILTEVTIYQNALLKSLLINNRIKILKDWNLLFQIMLSDVEHVIESQNKNAQKQKINQIRTNQNIKKSSKNFLDDISNWIEFFRP